MRSKRRHQPALWSALNLSEAVDGPKLGLGTVTVTEGMGLAASLLLRAVDSLRLRFWGGRKREW